MTDRHLNIDYKVYSSIDEMEPADRVLAKRASDARKTAYAPYSRFYVGAAVLLDNGEIVTGSNQENAASPSGLCAERTAMFAASAHNPGVPMVGIAIAGGPEGGLCNSPATPCGACRQVMSEYQKLGGKPMSVILVGASEIWKFSCVQDILPFDFDSLD